jgi:hypothetical protein
MPDYLDLASPPTPPALQDGVEASRPRRPPDGNPAPRAWLLSMVARMAVEVAVLAGRSRWRSSRTSGRASCASPRSRRDRRERHRDVHRRRHLGHTLDAGAQIDIDGVAFATVADLVVAGRPAPAPSHPGHRPGHRRVRPQRHRRTHRARPGVRRRVTLVPSVDDRRHRRRDRRGVRRPPRRRAPHAQPKAILIEDFEHLARRNPAVARAMAIDNYVPAGPGGTPPARPTSRAPSPSPSTTPPAPTPAPPSAAQIATDLEANRVANLAVAVIAPTYTRVDVQFTARSYPATTRPPSKPPPSRPSSTSSTPPGGASTATTRPNWTDTRSCAQRPALGRARRRRRPPRRHAHPRRYGDTQGTADITLDRPAALPAADSVVDGTVTP